MNSASVAQLIPTVQDALRAFLSTLVGKDVPLNIDPPVETTFGETSAQALAYLTILAQAPGVQYAVMLDERWLPLLSTGMLGEALNVGDEGADDFVRELAAQGHGTVANALTSTGLTLPDVTFTMLLPGNNIPQDALPDDLLEISFGAKIENDSLGGFALMSSQESAAPSEAPLPKQPQAKPEFPQAAAAAPAKKVDVAPLALQDLGSEVLHGDGGKGNLGLLADVELEISVELGRRKLPLADLLRLTTGSVVELEKLVGEPLEVYANGRLIAEGEAVVIDEQFGIRITTLASTKQRAKAFV